MKFERFGLGIGKGLWLTFRHVFRHWITTQYPEERLATSRRIRGTEFVWYESECTGCATCAKACPHGCIEVVTSRNGSQMYTVEKFEIDNARCMFCGLCVESCPYDALYMGRGYEAATYRRAEITEGKERLISKDKWPSAYFRPKLEKEIPEQGLLVYKKQSRFKWQSR